MRICEKCNKTATVYLTEIIDGKSTEIHLCDSCAQEEILKIKKTSTELLSKLNSQPIERVSED